MQPSMQAVKVAGQKIAQLETANAELRVSNRQLKVQVVLLACLLVIYTSLLFKLSLVFLGHPAAPVMSSSSACSHHVQSSLQAVSAFRFQGVLPDAAHGTAVKSDCSTIKAPACSVHHCKAKHVSQRSAAARNLLIPAEHTLHCQLLLKDADARMEPRYSNAAADL